PLFTSSRRRRLARSLEVLHRSLVSLCGAPSFEGAQVAPPASFRVLLARIEPILTRRKLAYHDHLLRIVDHRCSAGAHRGPHRTGGAQRGPDPRGVKAAKPRSACAPESPRRRGHSPELADDQLARSSTSVDENPMKSRTV